MPKIAQYYADAKLTPSDLGVTAWETAARRYQSLYSQTAEGDRELSRAIAQLWTEDIKFGLDQIDKRQNAGGVRFVGGNKPSGLLTGLGGAFNDRGAAGSDVGVNLPGQRVPYAGPQLQTQSEISRASSSIGNLVARLAIGQGLTDTEWAQLNAAKKAAPGYVSPLVGSAPYYGKGGITPNPDVTDEQAAQAGFNMGGSVYDNKGNLVSPAKYGSVVPGYPTPTAPSYLPPWSTLTDEQKANVENLSPGMKKIGSYGLDVSDIAGGSDLNPSDIPSGSSAVPSPDNGFLTGAANTWMNIAAAPANAGVSIWNAITGAFTPGPAMTDNTEETDNGGQ